MWVKHGNLLDLCGNKLVPSSSYIATDNPYNFIRVVVSCHTDEDYWLVRALPIISCLVRVATVVPTVPVRI